MALASGTRLGGYEVLGPLGAGGMGEVYRARDTKLGRDVAIKILPDVFAHDPDRLARFEREAQLLATLNHPNIAAIYGLEDSGQTRALVLELVEGETLADRIARGPIPLDEVLKVATQIAEALEAAHEQGIIHRDLKPANIKVTEAGIVKVLDFGLAKLTEPHVPPPPNASNVSMSPTITSPAMMTGVGVLLGTATYMAPEQARGRRADKRSDIWAFGCVLYEMLTGRRAFGGEDVSDTLANVLKLPPDWTALPAHTSPAVRRLLERCLDKDARRRVGDIAAARFVLEEQTILGGPSTAGAVPAAQPAWKRARAATVAAVAATVITAGVHWLLRTAEPAKAVTRFSLSLPDSRLAINARRQIDISPDGSTVLFANGGQLYVRNLSQLATRSLVTLTASGDPQPVFSPDGSQIAFSERNVLRRMPTAGGEPVTLLSTDATPFGLHWGTSDIVFAADARVMRVPAGGGMPQLVATVKNGVAYGPQLLPGGEAVLFTQTSPTAGNQWDSAEIVVYVLRDGTSKTLVRGGSDGRYVPSGHLLYAVAGTVFAQAFDLDRLETRGAAVPVLPGVQRSSGGVTGAAHFSVSNTGTLVYIPGAASPFGVLDLALTSRSGDVELLKLPPRPYAYPRVSPDGTQIAVQIEDGNESNVWIYDLGGASAIRRLTFGGRNRYPVWSADGQRVVFQSDREGDLGLWWQPANGTGTPERLTKADPQTAHIPNDWSPAGEALLYEVSRGTSTSLWLLTMRDRTAAAFAGIEITGGNFITAAFSPDGRWVAYASEEGGTQVNVQPFPPTGARYQIFSTGNPHHPMWSRDGKELFYVPRAGAFEAAAVFTRSTFSFGPPVAVPRTFPSAPPTTPRTFDITADGRVIGVIAPGESRQADEIQVVLNWFEELKRLVPVK